MVQSPSWAGNWFAASQIPRISRNPKVHYRTHKHPPTVSILGQPNPVHTPISHLLKFHPNIIHPSTPRSHQWSLSLRFPHQDPIHHLLLTHTRHMPSPSHSSRYTRIISIFIYLKHSTTYCGFYSLVLITQKWNKNYTIKSNSQIELPCITSLKNCWGLEITQNWHIFSKILIGPG